MSKIINYVDQEPSTDVSLSLGATGARWLHVRSQTLDIASAPPADHTVSGIQTTLTAATGTSFGLAVRINSNGNADLARADVIANAGAIAMCADALVATGTTGNYLLLGTARDGSWSWTPGGLLYLSAADAGAMTQTAPSATDNVVQVLGVALSATGVYFNPSLNYITHV